ncbi:MAG: hypothetical protein QOF85_1208 [Solirubrobacterales bacterium]|jgi:hypothetical protein|nr:hypothetical protein [Solirubrobacterales bacterium]
MRKTLMFVAATATVALSLATPLAQAELTAKGNLFVRFEGGIDPIALPRQRLAPITVSITGTVRTLSGQRPPALRKIRIALNSGGKLDSHGLPVCHYGQLVAASSRKALKACGDALVGDGDYKAQTAFPEQGTFPAIGHILAFNAIYRGHTAILAHIFGNDPVPISRIVVFRIQRMGGTYGTVITGQLPSRVNHYGYVERIALRLHRRFVYRGQSRSYLSAACAAPLGFSRALFPFARASMAFDDGRELSSTLTRSCTVKG